MSVGTIIVLIVLGVVVVYAITLYNGLVSLKHAVGKHLANIDVLLKQRHEELPKLVATCKTVYALRAGNFATGYRCAQPGCCRPE